MKDSLGHPCTCDCHSNPGQLDCECCEGRCVCGTYFNNLRGHMQDCPVYAIQYYKLKRHQRLGRVVPNAQRYQVLP